MALIRRAHGNLLASVRWASSTATSKFSAPSDQSVHDRPARLAALSANR